MGRFPAHGSFAVAVLALAGCGSSTGTGAERRAPDCSAQERVTVAPCSEEALEAAVGVTEALGLMGTQAEQLRVRGEIRMGAGTCTELECGVEQPCCNSCGAALLVVGPPGADPSVGDPAGDRLTLPAMADGTLLDCGGSNCGMCCKVDPLDREVVATLTRDGAHHVVASLCGVP